MGKQDIAKIFADQRFDTGQRRDLAAAGSAFALVIYSDQIQLRAVASNQSILVAQQLHPLLGKQILRTVFGVRINFVIAVAAVNAQRGGEAAYFFYTFLERVAGSGDEVP